MREFTLLLLLAIGGSLFAETISVPDDYATVAEAVTASSAGDTILISNGEYWVEDIFIDHSLSIIGEDSAETVLYGSGVAIFTLRANNITLQNFHLFGQATPMGNGFPALVADSCHSLRIRNMQIDGGHGGGTDFSPLYGGEAIIIERSSDILIMDSRMSGGDAGTTALGDPGDGAPGIYVNDSDVVFIAGSQLYGGGPGASGGCAVPGAGASGLRVVNSSELNIVATDIMGADAYAGAAGAGLELSDSDEVFIVEVNIAGGHGGPALCQYEPPFPGGVGVFSERSLADFVSVDIAGGAGAYNIDSSEVAAGGHALHAADSSILTISVGHINGGIGGPQGQQFYIDFTSVIDTSGITTPIEVMPGPAERLGFELHQNYPNPFNPSTVISLQLVVPSEITLTVYDIAGRKIRSLIQGQRLGAGAHTVTWNGVNAAGARAASGMYFYTLSTEGFSQTHRMLLVR